MADIELVIKMPESTYKVFKNLSRIIGILVYEKDILTLIKAVKNGTPLPKGHGELIDRNEMEYLKAIHDAKYGYISWSDAIKQIKYSAPTIIEADKASEG